MKLIDFTKIGGYRLKQATLRYMQEAYFWILKSFISYLGIPDTGKYIISGCTINGANITDGILFIDGELCPFTQAPGTLASKIKKNVVTDTLGFENGNNEPVFRTTTAVIDPTGTALSAFSRLYPVYDQNYVHTDNNFTALLLAKLTDIEAGAEVNVNPDWNVINPLSKKFIFNKPNIAVVLTRGSFIAGDLSSGDSETVLFPSDIGTDQYYVFPVLRTISSPNNSANVTFVVHTLTSAGFKVCQRETSTTTQSLIIDYIVFPR